ncbi:hypothetical protein NQK81_00960 [Amycolatopsis roodepoortensis]|uniref:hypothetical protein n=1 Tax=Amycolatopsis roodepoortensis TaxID=700274 RepID=UPI00214BD674|nr:hypothetical protein [Amycolatopsis roodepoortensis]UUV32046.1 hypothetical protein NQK81_00960 [Amycolatopsis roodepoortensis]
MSTQTQHRLHTTTNPMADYAAGPQRQQLAPAVHSGIAPIDALSSGVVRMPGYHHALPHLHAYSEITIFVAYGLVASLVGDELEHTFVHSPHSIMTIGKGVPHIGVNLSAEVAMVFEARTDPDFNTDVERIPRLDTLAEARVAQVQNDYRNGRFHDQLQTASWSTAVWNVHHS